MKQFSISQLAQQAGVQVETVKFYQRRGLIEQPPRPESGFRKYSPETVRQIRFICCAGRRLNESKLRAAGIGQPLS